MARKLITISVFFALLFASWRMHPFYLSVTDLVYSSSAGTLHGTVKLFTNDLEDAIARLEGRRPDILGSRDTAGIRLALKKYLAPRLSIEVNGRPAMFTLLGYENEEEATWLYIESSAVDLPSRVRIENTLLYDFLPQQINIVHLRVGESSQSRKVAYPDRGLQFDF